MGRTIMLPEGPGDPSPANRSHPDTLEVIHRPDAGDRDDDGGDERGPGDRPGDDADTAPGPATDSRDPDLPGTPVEGENEDEPAGSGELEQLLREYHEERERGRSVRSAKVLVTLLALGLLAVWLLRAPEDGGSENRADTPFPRVSTDGLVGGSDYRQTDAALRDRLALRQYVVRTIGRAARDDLGTSLSSQVVMGPSGVPFISEDFVFPCEHDFDPGTVDTGLRQLQAIGARTGKSVTVAIAPDKSSILTSQLGRRSTGLMACSDAVRADTISTWPGGPASPVLTTWRELSAEQADHPGKVFQRGDSHWTSQGALVWSRALLSHLIDAGEAPEALRGAPEATRAADEPADNDLYRLMGVSRSETVPVWQVHRPELRIRARSLPSPSGRGIALFRSAPFVTAGEKKDQGDEDTALVTGRTLVIDDSFFSRAEGHLAPYFSNLKVMHFADFLTAVRDGDLPHFDRIVIETVQRGWPERSAWLEPGHPVHAALAAELARPRSDAGTG